MKLLSFLVCILLYTPVLFSGDLAFFPVHVNGDLPAEWKNEEKLDYKLSSLFSFYARDNFVIEVADVSKLQQWMEAGKVLRGKKLERSTISGICQGLDVSYVVWSELDFVKRPYLVTELYNCSGTVINRKEGFLYGEIYSDLEDSLKTLLQMFPPRLKKELSSESKESKKELIFALDLSGSFMREIQAIRPYIRKVIRNQNIPVGLLLFGPAGTTYISPTYETKKIEEALKAIRYGGEVTANHIINGLHKLRGSAAGLEGEVILLTDVKLKSSEIYNLQSGILSVKQLGYSIKIVSNSSGNNQSLRALKRAAGASGTPLQAITSFKKVGTNKGYRMIFLKDNQIYFNKRSGVNPGIIDTNNLESIEESRIYAYADYPHPNNMVAIYSKVTGEKILEVGNLQSDVSFLLENLTRSLFGSDLQSWKKVLIKTGHYSSWIYLGSIQPSLVGKLVTFKTTFQVDKTSSSGYTNVPSDTHLHSGEIPELLLLKPSEIRSYLKTHSGKKLSCFIKGTVLEIR